MMPWITVEGRDAAELFTKMDKWEDKRRIVVSRVITYNDKHNQLSLFEKEYRYFFFVANDDSLNTEEVVLFYEKRDNCKNYIKESE